jgi:hypothetical protein
LVLNALGGDCLDDFDRLREDAGLKEMLGHEIPSPEAARKFLYQFHGEQEIVRAQAELPVGQVSFIPRKNEPLRALAQVNQIWSEPSGGVVRISGSQRSIWTRP